MLRFIARTRLKYPRCQALMWLAISIICVLSSSKFWLVEWSTLRFIAAILGVLFLVLLPIYSPQNRLNLRDILRNDIYALVRGVGTVRFFSIFNSLGSYLKPEEDLSLYLAAISLYLYFLAVDVRFGVDEDLGLSDGLIFAVYSQLWVPAWMISRALNLLVVYKYLYPQAPVEVEEEHEDEFFDFEEEDAQVDIEEAQVEIDVFEVEIHIDEDIDEGADEIADVDGDGLGDDEGADEIADVDGDGIGDDEIAAVLEGNEEAEVNANAEAIVVDDEIADLENEVIVVDEGADEIADLQADPWVYCVLTIVVMILFLAD